MSEGSLKRRMEMVELGSKAGPIGYYWRFQVDLRGILQLLKREILYALLLRSISILLNSEAYERGCILNRKAVMA